MFCASAGVPAQPLFGRRPSRAPRAQRLGRQIARRQACGRTSVVAVQAAPGMPLGREVRGLVERAAPDYVLAAVDAACKRVDVEHWIGELLRVDALALWDLSGTRTPAELLGVVPIAFVDGEPSSSLGWTLALAGRAMASRRPMTRRDLQWFVGEVQRYRPLATVVLAVAVVLPSLWELATGNLSACHPACPPGARPGCLRRARVGADRRRPQIRPDARPASR